MNNLSMSQTKKALLNKKISAEELTKFYLSRIEKFSRLNAFITVCRENAIEQAKLADKNIASGEARYLDGIPLGIKDLFQGVKNKIEVLTAFLESKESSLSEVAYIGDDLNDMSCISAIKKSVGLIGCPANAVDKIIASADFVSQANGGEGAVREFIEFIMKDND